MSNQTCSQMSGDSCQFSVGWLHPIVKGIHAVRYSCTLGKNRQKKNKEQATLRKKTEGKKTEGHVLHSTSKSCSSFDDHPKSSLATLQILAVYWNRSHNIAISLINCQNKKYNLGPVSFPLIGVEVANPITKIHRNSREIDKKPIPSDLLNTVQMPIFARNCEHLFCTLDYDVWSQDCVSRSP